MSGLKSGQRVAGSSKVEVAAERLPAPHPIRGRVLHRQKHGFAVGREAGAAQLGSDRHAEEQLRKPARLALRRYSVEAVGFAGLRPRAALVGGNPKAAHGVNGTVVGRGEPAVGAGLRVPQRADLRNARVAALDEHIPFERRCRVVAVGRRHLDDVAELVLRARVGLVDVLRAAALVVGEHDVDLARAGSGLHILGTIHARGLERIGGQSRVDQDLRLRGEAVPGVSGPCPNTRGSHWTLPSVIEAGHRERTLRQQAHVVRLVALAERLLGDEAIDVVECASSPE